MGEYIMRDLKQAISLSFTDSATPKVPGLDIGICGICGWRGMLAECDTEQDGDWESGYYEFPLCPVCKDGGYIDDFDYSPEQLEKYNKYRASLNEV